VVFRNGMWRSILAIGLMGLAIGATACGGDDDDEAAGGGGATTTEAAKPAIKVGLVTDIGGLNDRSFNALANKGLQDAKAQLGIQGRVITSDQNSDYVPNLSTLAQQKYDLVIGIGFLMAEAVNTVATRFPDTKFAMVDSSQAALKDKPTNVEGLLFAEQEAGYLVGYLSGLYAKEKGFDTISSVGGQKIPPVDHYIAGYQAGAKAANPDIKTLNGYSQDFVDQAKCKEIALDQIERGAGIVFQVAGQCGLGAIDAAKQEGKQGIGVDADQGYLGAHVLTSATKKVDVAVFQTIKSVQDDAFAAGKDTLFDLKNDGVGIGKISSEGASLDSQLDPIKEQITGGELEIPDTVK
jgi:basic membrane protein A and related proteins